MTSHYCVKCEDQCRVTAALLKALEEACGSVMPDRFGDGRPRWYDNARAAIAQAKGESND